MENVLGFASPPKHASLFTRRLDMISAAYLRSVMLHRSETWTTKLEDIKKPVWISVDFTNGMKDVLYFPQSRWYRVDGTTIYFLVM